MHAYKLITLSLGRVHDACMWGNHLDFEECIRNLSPPPPPQNNPNYDERVWFGRGKSIDFGFYHFQL